MHVGVRPVQSEFILSRMFTDAFAGPAIIPGNRGVAALRGMSLNKPVNLTQWRIGTLFAAPHINLLPHKTSVAISIAAQNRGR